MKYFIALFCLFATCHAYSEPEEAFGPLAQDNSQQDAGELVVVDDLTLYVVRPTGAEYTNKAVVWGHDIFGWESGRTKEMVDQIAADTG